MARKNHQISLYQQRKKIKQSVVPLKLKYFHFNYLFRFIKKYKKLSIGFLVFLFIQVLLEVALPLFSRGYAKRFSSLLEREHLLFVLIFLIIGVIIYLIISFLGIKLEKSLIVYLLNELRRNWLNLFLNKPDMRIKDQDKSYLVAKISYHFPLIQMGISNSVIGAVKWILYVFGLILITFFVSSKLLFIVLISIPVNILIIFAGYFIAKFYISKETTLYSDIIKHITSSLYDLSFIQKHKMEKHTMKRLDDLVLLDTFFRIRRNLWIVFGNKIIFGFLILIIGFSYLFQISFPNFFLASNFNNLLFSGIIFIYLARLFYISLRIGIFSFPAKLGLILLIPETFYIKSRKDKIKDFSLINFHSKKAKLFKEENYLKNINLEFKTGDRTLIYGKSFIGKTKLGFLLAGESVFNINAWIVKVDKQRYFYKDWVRNFRNSYFISSNFLTDRSLSEILIGKNKENILEKDISESFSILSKYKEFDFIFALKKSLATNFDEMKFNPTSIFLVQSAYCLINKPKIIIIDNIWVDLKYEKINKVLQILNNDLPNSIIIFLSSEDNSFIKYDQKYILSNKEIKKQ